MRPGAHAFGIGRDRRIVEQAQDCCCRPAPRGRTSRARARGSARSPTAACRRRCRTRRTARRRSRGTPPAGRARCWAPSCPRSGGPRAQFAADVPEFLQVDHARALGDLGLERRVAARAAAARDEIAALLLLGQREELRGHVPGAVDQVLRDAVVADDREAEALERPAEILREAFGIAVLILQAERRHVGGKRRGGGGVEHVVCVRESAKARTLRPFARTCDSLCLTRPGRTAVVSRGAARSIGPAHARPTRLRILRRAGAPGGNSVSRIRRACARRSSRSARSGSTRCCRRCPRSARRCTRASEADWPLVITAFVLGFGLAQPIHGPLADRFGRRPVLMWSLGIYVVAMPGRDRGQRLHAVAGGAFHRRLRGRVDPRGAGGDGARPPRRPGDGEGHQPDLHGVHGGADAWRPRWVRRSCWSARGG